MDRGGVKPWFGLVKNPQTWPECKTRSRARRCSLRLNAGRPDHLAPLLGIVDDEFAELGG
jgi:hypothetical protein